MLNEYRHIAVPNQKDFFTIFYRSIIMLLHRISHSQFLLIIYTKKE